MRAGATLERMAMPRVLVVEDDVELRDVLVRGLREEGFAVGGLGTGGELLEQLGDARRPICSCSTSACRTPTAATSARRCARRGSGRPSSS